MWDVCTAIKSFLSSGVLHGDLNFTYVTLIPKVKNPKDMIQLRPIALRNVLYMICSKVLANRLKSILDKVISPLQSAFVPGRLISDNTLVATEVAHFLHTNRTGKDDHFSLKLNISKAYDRLEWEFVRCILLKLGFVTEWVELIMTTLATVSYSFLVNGREVLTQGLRWRIGSGSHVNIWQHRWIPDSFPRCPSSPPAQGAPQFVSELINPATRTWDVHKLNMFFPPADIELILTIPLSGRPLEDRPIWHFHKKGTFTINNVYFVATDIHLRNVLAPPPPSDPFGKLWKAIWRAKVPGKVSMHIWRSCAGISPTREGL
ncbi:hypothetical protein ACLB2K_027006 [Fragaria x ananassa]